MKKIISPEQAKENKRVLNVNKFIRVFNASKNHEERAALMSKIEKYTTRYDALRVKEAEEKAKK
jgi:hypothetical protein